MKVLIMGAGVIGVSTAYELVKAGCDVSVVDRQPAAGLETSFANAGEISPGYASPWAGPGVPLKAVQWMLDKHGPLVVHPRLDPLMWRWMLQTLFNCTSRRYTLNKSRMVPISEYSRDCLRRLRADTGISYDHRSQGTLQLFRKQSQLDSVDKDITVLREYGVRFELLDRNGCIRAEPALGGAPASFVGGLLLPDDETGDCHLFTQRLMAMAQEAGVRLIANTRIESVTTEGDRVTAVVTDSGTMTADAFVMALGSFSPLLLRPIGIDIPVYPVKGYSITVPLTDDSGAPRSTVMDETYKVAITRLGDRIRVGGTAELSGYRVELSPERRITLERSLRDLFPRGGDIGGASFWSGLRPMTPDGPPIIGPTRYTNLHLNTGHGTLGWTMGAGSGRAIADIVNGLQPEVDFAFTGMPTTRHGVATPRTAQA
jgi:D-amino-acid dehydrogenase